MHARDMHMQEARVNSCGLNASSWPRLQAVEKESPLQLGRSMGGRRKGRRAHIPDTVQACSRQVPALHQATLAGLTDDDAGRSRHQQQLVLCRH